MTPTDDFAFLPEQAASLGVDLPPVQRLSLTTPDGRHVSALRWGRSDPEITLVHGAGLNAHTWDATILCSGLPTLAIDLPGHGESSWRDDADYRPETLAPDVITALTTWTRSPQILVGHSLGGLTAATVAATRPDLVRELIMVDITPSVTTDGSAQLIRDFFAGPDSWTTRDEMVDRALAFGLGGSRATATRGVALNSRQRADGRWEWKHHFAHLAHQAAPPLPPAASGWNQLTQVTAPVVLIRGEHGFVSDQAAAEFAATIPGATVISMKTGHNVHEERPQELAEILRNQARENASTDVTKKR